LKTLHRYITGQVLAALLLTVAVSAFVVLLMNVLHDVLPLLLGGHVPLRLVAKAVGLEIPFACVYALPMGFITATLLVFGRFSADQELTATRASGISLLSLITPVLGLSLLCCALSAWFNMDLGPRSRVEFLRMKYDLMGAAINAQFPEGQVIRKHYLDKTYDIYVARISDGALEDVNVYQMVNETNWDVLVHAPRGRLLGSGGTNQIVMQLLDARILRGKQVDAIKDITLNYSPDPVTNQVVKPKISDMTFGQLREELRELQGSHLTRAGIASPGGLSDLHHLNLSVKTNASPEEVGALLRQAGMVRDEQIGRVRAAMHGEIAFSFACFGFTLVGIPLAIRVHRRETNVGIAVALGLVAVYYGFTMVGNSLASHAEFYPHLILWAPNFLFQGIGAVLLWRANRGI
jgi:lipopolysaccharide export system permease protein